jgi:hypothetical protein
MSYSTASNLGAPTQQLAATTPSVGWTTRYPVGPAGLVLSPDFRQVSILDVLAAAGVDVAELLKLGD